MRLSTAERSLLKVLENALEVSEYTDAVDVSFSHTHKTKYARILEELIDILSTSSGLMVSSHLCHSLHTVHIYNMLTVPISLILFSWRLIYKRAKV